VDEIEFWLYRYENPAPHKVNFIPVRKLTSSEYEAAGTAIQIVSDAMRGFDDYLRRAMEDLRMTVADLLIKLTDINFARQSELWVPDIKYRVLNVSAGLRMYEEYVEAEVARLWTNNSVQWKLMKDIFHDLYDGSLPYRIIYYLRNALVHGAGSLTTAKARAWLETEDGTEYAKAEFSLLLSRSAFMKTVKARAALRDEIANLASDPDLIELCERAYVDLTNEKARLFPLVHPEVAAAAGLLFQYIVELQAVGGGGPHFHSHAPSNGFEKLSQLAMTRSVFDYVIDPAHRIA
jgi:hypothetical protein